MSKKKAFCSTCRSLVNFQTKDAKRSTELDGQTYTYPVKIAICKKCKDAASYQPYTKYNGRQFAKVVRKSNNIVSLKIIKNLPKKYNVKPQVLSRMLDLQDDCLGDIYTRFMGGLVPSIEVSNKLKKWNKDPLTFIRVLIDHEDEVGEKAVAKSFAKICTMGG